MERVIIRFKDARTGEEKFSFSLNELNEGSQKSQRSGFNEEKLKKLYEVFNDLSEEKGMQWLKDMLQRDGNKTHMKLLQRFKQIDREVWLPIPRVAFDNEKSGENDPDITIEIGQTDVSYYIRIEYDGWLLFDAYYYELIPH
jgi:hypothetical protein